MRLKDAAFFDAAKAKNTDPYGSAIFKYAQDWADAMEAAIVKGAKLADVYEKLSFEVADDITGFMYAAARGILRRCWEHGEELWQLEKAKRQKQDV